MQTDRPRPLEGPGSDARLKALRSRFSRVRRGAEWRRAGWRRLVLLCAGVFLAVLVGGLWLSERGA